MATVSYELSSDHGTLEVYDLAGRSITERDITNAQGELRLNTSSYEAGVYVVVVRQKNGYTMQQKLVIE
ncbi:T9SS type A sorting domain-containing protein [Brumimicrobium oceani]|uniref:Secretion system C-terminal sorting domain-containing protein n=1 Tax=Brumimicrobium oceani TaxID=2100725 RepID=A0A2U2XG05_9FLAO|nr:T9SS type A sorting domain-containing protein [Brumimicrobium oceani]PWH86738.1 hypothetical protein DIT68_00285 [Brumimicrobium oceani]